MLPNSLPSNGSCEYSVAQISIVTMNDPKHTQEALAVPIILFFRPLERIQGFVVDKRRTCIPSLLLVNMQRFHHKEQSPAKVYHVLSRDRDHCILESHVQIPLYGSPVFINSVYDQRINPEVCNNMNVKPSVHE